MHSMFNRVHRLALGLGVLATALGPYGAVTAKDSIDVGVVAFLSGPAAGPFGVPGKNGAELVIDAINAGTLPAPYDTAGFAGATLNPIHIDESGGNAKQVAEYRNLVEKQGVDAVIGYISSGTCLAVTPVAEELKKLTILSVCGTPRIFEDGDWTHIFRTQAHAVGDSIAAALYVRDNFGDVAGYTGINQNYAWGQDSWKSFSLAMGHFVPKAEVSSTPQFPKIFAGQYGTEISTLALDDAELVHSSFWDGDIEAFVVQAKVRGFFDNKQFLSTVGASAIDSLGSEFPDGTIIGTRGEIGILVREKSGPLNMWFVNAYRERYGAWPLGPSYQYAQAVLALKIAMDKAARDHGGFPTQDQVIAAMKGLSFETFAGRIELALGNGHQAVHPVGYGITRWNDETGEPEVTNITFYPSKCIYPPAGKPSLDWLAEGMPGSDC
ncbi:MAG: ABC transporter substrate-binding protein [Thiotrichales bacterium]|nr:ABC transporter substrate-binding protein [Thiotrichales bacterium]